MFKLQETETWLDVASRSQGQAPVVLDCWVSLAEFRRYISAPFDEFFALILDQTAMVPMVLAEDGSLRAGYAGRGHYARLSREIERLRSLQSNSYLLDDPRLYPASEFARRFGFQFEDLVLSRTQDRLPAHFVADGCVFFPRDNALAWAKSRIVPIENERTD